MAWLRCALLLAVCLGWPGLAWSVRASVEDDPPPHGLVARSAAYPVTNVGDAGAVSFLFGAFCALWAQNTERSAWLWFFLGLFFSVIAVIVLLTKNADDNFDRRQYGRTTRDLR